MQVKFMYFLIIIVIVILLSCSNLLRRILRTLRRIERSLSSIGVASSIEFQSKIDGLIRKVTHMFLKVNQKLPVSVVFKDKFGNDAKVDGKPEWAVSDASLATLEVAEDGLSATLSPLGTVGSLKVQVSADADLGEGVKTILGELPVDLLGGDADVVQLVPGTPVDVA